MSDGPCCWHRKLLQADQHELKTDRVDLLARRPLAGVGSEVNGSNRKHQRLRVVFSTGPVYFTPTAHRAVPAEAAIGQWLVFFVSSSRTPCLRVEPRQLAANPQANGRRARNSKREFAPLLRFDPVASVLSVVSAVTELQ